MKHSTKTLYSVLGIAPDAHPEVVKAAYRALAKQYHPDGEGGGLHGLDKFIELQDAYEVLSDPARRAAYDAMLFGEDEAIDYSIADDDQEASIDPDDIWASKVAIHPEIESLYEILDGYSQALGNRFRLAVINGECEDDPALFASELDRVFFAKYFGDNPDVRLIARRLLTIGNRRAAKVLNKAVQRGKLRDPHNISRLLGVFDRLLPRDLRILPEQEAAEVETAAFDHVEKLRLDPFGPPPASVSSPGRFILGLSLSALVAVILGGLFWFNGGSLNRLAGTETAPPDNGQFAVVKAPEEPIKVGPETVPETEAEASARQKKQIYDRIVGSGELSGNAATQLTEEPPVPLEQVQPAQQVTEPQTPALENQIPALDAPDQSTTSQGTTDLDQPPPPLPPPPGAETDLDQPPPPPPPPSAETNAELMDLIEQPIKEEILPPPPPDPSGQAELMDLIEQPIKEEIETLPQTDRSKTANSGKRRVALVIGNASYRRIPWLENPDNDARAMSEALARLGWEVKTVIDGSLSSMWLAILSFSNSLGKDVDAALVYYSGHAVEIDSTNLLLPIDIAREGTTNIRNDAVSTSEVIQLLEENDVPIKILILDACRNNPLKDESNQGLALVSAESGVFIAYSTKPGTVASDGVTSAENSPFTSALVRALKSPAQTIEETFRDVRSEVIRVTNGKQVPWESSSLTSGFSFANANEGQSVVLSIDASSAEEIGVPIILVPPAAFSETLQATPPRKTLFNIFDRSDSVNPSQNGLVASLEQLEWENANRLATQNAPSGTGYVVQLSSFRSQADAQQEFARLKGDFPNVVSGLPQQIRQTTVAGIARFQLALGPLGSRSAATMVCNQLFAAGESNCIVRGP